VRRPGATADRLRQIREGDRNLVLVLLAAQSLGFEPGIRDRDDGAAPAGRMRVALGQAVFFQGVYQDRDPPGCHFECFGELFHGAILVSFLRTR
jgi:hypothetical protein